MMNDMIHVVVKLSESVTDLVGHEILEYGLTPQAKLGGLIALMYAKYPKLSEKMDNVELMINGKPADLQVVLKEGDEVTVDLQEMG
ncbi:MAG: hypothetical protein JSV03_10830 [Planctomycetota bacterium]|nr:MAG: hypothetical protein JSV03_10830 [Planctomycetota bacterium]